MQLACAIFSSVGWSAPQYFSTLSHKQQDFLKTKKVTENYICVWTFSTNLSEIFLILRRTERDMTKNVYWSSREAPVLLAHILTILGTFSTDFRKIVKNQISWKFIHWETSCSTRTERDRQTDGRTDVTKLTVVLCNFARAPKSAK